MTSQELYQLISDDLKSEKRYLFSNLREGMGIVRDNKSEKVILLNDNIKAAWELITTDRRLSIWNLSDLDLASILDMPDIPKELAIHFCVDYHFEVSEYQNGVASVSWMIQPNCFCDDNVGRFGMEEDKEITLVAFIDQLANILVPFQPMDYNNYIQYRNLAEEMIMKPEEINYVCLNPELSIPLLENMNLKKHKNLLRKKIFGLMFLLASLARNKFHDKENDAREGIFTAINPNQEQFLFIGLRIKEVEGQENIFDIHVITGLFKDEIMKSFYTEMDGGSFTAIESIMLNRENIDLILDDFIRTAEMLCIGSMQDDQEM